MGHQVKGLGCGDTGDCKPVTPGVGSWERALAGYGGCMIPVTGSGERVTLEAVDM